MTQSINLSFKEYKNYSDHYNIWRTNNIFAIKKVAGFLIGMTALLALLLCCSEKALDFVKGHKWECISSFAGGYLVTGVVLAYLGLRKNPYQEQIKEIIKKINSPRKPLDHHHIPISNNEELP